MLPNDPQPPMPDPADATPAAPKPGETRPPGETAAALPPRDPSRPRSRPGWLRGPATGLLVAVVFVAGVWVGRVGPAGGLGGTAAPSPTAAAGPTDGDVDGLALIEEAWGLLHDKYVGKDTLDERELAYGAIDGLADAVGDTGHTTFMTPEDRESRNDSLSGSYVGIGVQVNETDSGLPVIVGVFRDSPADKAGLATGDVIVAVDGRPTSGEAMDAILSRIRGEAGTTVEITVRAGETGPERTVDIVRAEVDIEAVSWTVVPGTSTGLLRIEQFSNGVADDVKAALRELREAGAERLVLDLRGNPGGYVGEAVGTASQFLGSGTVYVERNAEGEEKANEVTGDGAWTDLPLVVLVDQGSASSSEIVSGALQDHDRATLVGVTTFGTGTVLGEFGLSDGSALRIGTVEWLTPDGRRIWHEGIEPDIEVERPTEVLPTVPDDLRDVAASRVGSIADAQLRRALEEVAAD
jgi:carboxyl-terminal processing protease